MITCIPSTETIATCQGCGRANYDSDSPWSQSRKEVDQLYDVRVNTRGTSHQTSVTKFCADCLQELNQAIFQYRRGS